MARGEADWQLVNEPTHYTSSARQVLLQALLLGLIADNVLRTAGDGLGWTAWVVFLSIGALLVIWQRGDRPNFEQSAWLGVAIAFAAAFAWRDAEPLRQLNVLGTLTALALFAMASARAPVPSILSARLRDLATAGVYAARDAITGAAHLVLREAALGAGIGRTAAARSPALRAALLAIPVVIVFAALLSRADPVFESIFSLPEIDLERVIEHLFLIGLFAWLSAGWMRGALLGTARRRALPDGLPVQLGVVEVTTVLGAVVALFTVFVALQLRWLFGGTDVVLATTGLTLAEYARRGFFELVAVAALVVPLVLGTRAAIVDDATIHRHRQLSVALLVLLAPIIVSAMLRMRLYVMHFGLTTDRLYASVFMAWLAVVFVFMTLTVLRGWSRPFATMAVVSGFLTLSVLNALSPDAIVARVNLDRTATTRGVDYEYLAGLSGDATPIVAAALAKAEPSAEACESAKALRRRWLPRDGTDANLGAKRGRDAVIDLLTPPTVLRLCAVSPQT